MKITDRLIGDHKTFLKLSAQINEIFQQPPPTQNQNKLIRIVELYKDHLLLHAWVEDTFYYPAVRAALNPSILSSITTAYMNHLDHEHKTIDGYLDRLESELKSHPPVISWPQTFALFHLGLKSHMRKEEEELFPASENLLGRIKLEELSEEVERNRSQALRIRIHHPAE